MRRTTILLALGTLGVVRTLRVQSRQMSVDCDGQTVLITGGSRGLGFALAREFARQGARIARCGRDPGALEGARKTLRAEGAEVHAGRCDVANREDVTRFVDEVVRGSGHATLAVLPGMRERGHARQGSRPGAGALGPAAVVGES